MLDALPPSIIWLLIVCTVFVTVSTAFNWVLQWRVKLKEPNSLQDKILNEHEQRVSESERTLIRHGEYLTKDKKRFKELEEGSRVTQEAILALLSHALDGNNINDLTTSKKRLHDYLYGTNKQ